ncbi:MAG TPA: dihydroxyacetone kinase subunit DhaL [Actinomycetota bacterium]|jgi:dihydroxyacetone kinase-like protein|nr:dihydroxyacetone kinase subunit DhaL [Actinomycetota bacterium]
MRTAERLDGAFVERWIRETARDVHAQRDFLTQLDAAIGDADHGINLDRGFAAALAKLHQASDGSPGAVLGSVGTTLVLSVGGAAGPLYGSAFRHMGGELAHVRTFDAEGLLVLLRTALAEIQRLGAAEVGDKTIVDAFEPATQAFERGLRAGEGLEGAARRARAAAGDGMLATTPLEARKGRASYLGPRSIGHQDPGATSTAILFAALERATRDAGAPP